MEKKKKSDNRGKENTKNKSNQSDKISRVVCDCEATKHPLVNNCMNCGRVVCLSEGPGPCFFCGCEVSYENDPLLPPKFTKESNNKQKQNFEKKAPDPTETLKLRNKLLEFDKNCASRTSVIDDESDYYQTNNMWLTKSEREKWEKIASVSHDKKHESRLLKKLMVDVTGRVLEQEDNQLDMFYNMNAIQDDRHYDYDNPYSNFTPDIIARPIYVNNNSLLSTKSQQDIDYVNNRVQDKGILEISDKGVCLSMHQPYASLLVRGIKKTEGRTWYSSHRGRLWIASAAKEPKAEEIKAIEDVFRLTSNEEIIFPKTYPTGCLIGCVTVTDVLSQEEYQKLKPDSTVESPYIFMCEDYFELPMKYPLQGQHKIYKLEPVIHRAALNCLEKTCKDMSRKAR